MTASTEALVLHNLSAARECLIAGDHDHALATVIDSIALLARSTAPAPPRAPELARSWLPGALVWRCSACPKVLGYVLPAKHGAPARFMVSHFNRRIEFPTSEEVSQTCDGCGTINRWPHASP